jgi:hypothetical protein
LLQCRLPNVDDSNSIQVQSVDFLWQCGIVSPGVV